MSVRYRVLIVMGVSGSGKTTVGPLLAAALGWSYAEGDQYHPPANIAKMKSGRPLTDADRAPWLAGMATAIDEWLAADRPTVLACSALKRSYRDALKRGHQDVGFVWLKGDRETIAARLAGRRGHFMPAALLESQFRTLEEPADAIEVDVRETPERIVATVLKVLQMSGQWAARGR